MFFSSFSSFLFRKEAQDLGLGLSLSLSTSSTGTHGFSPQQLKHVHTTTYDPFHCIIVKVWQQPSSCSSLIFFPGPPTTEWDPPSLWVLHLFFSHNFDFIIRRSLSLSLSSGGLVQLDSLRGLLGSLLLVGHKRLHAGGEHHLIHHKMPSYVRFPAMKKAFCSCSTITGSSLDSQSIPLSLPPTWVDI